MIMEADEIVGRVLNRLEENGIADDTLVIFMSDNGPASSSSRILDEFGHNQKQVDLPDGTTIELAGIKGGQGEAGLRTPFLWRYPRRFAAQTIYDPMTPVSTVDIYATLAELIEYNLDCNEAPDSRSLVKYLDTVLDLKKRSHCCRLSSTWLRPAMPERSHLKIHHEYCPLYGEKRPRSICASIPKNYRQECLDVCQPYRIMDRYFSNPREIKPQ